MQISRSIARKWSGVVETLLADCRDEPTVELADGVGEPAYLDKAVDFLNMHAVSPPWELKRHLINMDLVESGAPQWAADYINAFASEEELDRVMDIADGLQINM